MEPMQVNPDVIGFWKWVAGIVIAAASGAFTSAIILSKYIAQLDNACTAIRRIESHFYKEKGGLNVLTEERHTEICIPNMKMIDQDFDHFKQQIQGIKNDIADIKQDMSIILNASHESGQYAEELKKMNTLMAEINYKLGKAWKMDQDSQVGHG